MITPENILEITALADEIVETIDGGHDGASAMACLMAASTFIVSEGITEEMAVKALLSFISIYSETVLEQSTGTH